jgi:uncharacterized protein (TIGR02722 family)
MKLLNKKTFIAAAFAFALTGCADEPTRYVDSRSDDVALMGLDYKDFETAATIMVDDMLSSDLLVHPQAGKGGRYVVTVTGVVNDTNQRIDTDQLTKKIRTSLLNSGRFVVTTAITANGPEDIMTAKSRELSNSKLVNQKTVKKMGRVIAPDFSLTGKIIEQNRRVDKKTQQVEYYFQLTLTNLDDGLAYWEKEYPIIKRGSNKSVSW